MLYIVETVMLLLGLVVCLFGYKLFRFWLSVCGALLGAAAGLLVAGFTGLEGAMLMVAALVGVAVMLILVNLAYKLSVAISGFVTGYGLAHIAVNLFDSLSVVNCLWISVAVGAVFCLFALIFTKRYVVYATAISGANMAVTAAVSMFYCTSYDDLSDFLRDPTQLHSVIILLCVAVLATIGIITQLKFRKRDRVRLDGHSSTGHGDD